MDEIDYAALASKTRQDFIRFIDALLEDYEQWPEEWEGLNLPTYLRGIAIAAEKLDKWLIANEQDPEQASWFGFATYLLGAKSAKPTDTPPEQAAA